MAASTGVGSRPRRPAVAARPQGIRPPAASRAKLGAALVQGDPKQPGPERPRILIPAAVLPDGQKRLLEQFLGSMPVAGHPADEGQQRAGIPSQQGAHGLTVALGHPHHQFLVLRGRSSSSAPRGPYLIICAEAEICCSNFLSKMPFYAPGRSIPRTQAAACSWKYRLPRILRCVARANSGLLVSLDRWPRQAHFIRFAIYRSSAASKLEMCPPGPAIRSLSPCGQGPLASMSGSYLMPRPDILAGAVRFTPPA